MLKNYLFSPLCSAPFLCPSPPFSFSFSTAHFFFFSVSWLAAPLLLLFSSSLLFLFFSVLPFIFQPKILFFFNPNVFQPQNTFFSPKRFCFSPKLFSVQPKTFFFFQFGHSSLLLLFCRHVALLSSAFYFFSPSFISFLQLRLSKAQYSLQRLHISSI